jgi:hypothetical protein
MALEIGNIAAENGMSKAIYDALYNNLKSNFNEEKPPEDVCASWKKLAYSISSGIIEHIKSNMVIKGITAKGSVSSVVKGSTAPAVTDAHIHELNLTGTGEGIVFTQVDGTGYVE